jgi:uncharacterized membrane protein YsdA (DUF1294 family)
VLKAGSLNSKFGFVLSRKRNKMKAIKRRWLMLIRSKTNLFATLIAGLSAAQLAIPAFIHKMTPEMFAGIGIIIAMLIAYFRSKTTESIHDKADQE